MHLHERDFIFVRVVAGSVAILRVLFEGPIDDLDTLNDVVHRDLVLSCVLWPGSWGDVSFLGECTRLKDYDG